MRQPDQNQDDLMVLAAWLYYDEQLTHEQIAQKVGLSRIAVTRLLQKARRDGIVQIKITKPLPLHHHLARSLQQTFGLKHAIVVKTRGAPDETLEEIGRSGADYLKRIVFTGCRIGVGWSTTVSRMAPYLEAPSNKVECVVNDLAGSYLGHLNPYSISMRLAQVFGARLEALPTPAFMQNREARDAVLREQSIAVTLDHARHSDIAVVGLGDVARDTTLVRMGYLTPDQIGDLRDQGAVGDMLLHFYDINGRPVVTPIESRVISLGWEHVRRIPHIVVLAAGPTKVDATVGALRGGLCHCLITDIETAEAVLARRADGVEALGANTGASTQD